MPIERWPGANPRTPERGLADRDFVATEGFTVAHILLAQVLSASVEGEGLIAPCPGVAANWDRCLARPAWKRTIEGYRARVEAGVPSNERRIGWHGYSTSASSASNELVHPSVMPARSPTNASISALVASP